MMALALRFSECITSSLPDGWQQLHDLCHAGFSGSDPVQGFTPSPAAMQPSGGGIPWRPAPAQHADDLPMSDAAAAVLPWALNSQQWDDDMAAGGFNGATVCSGSIEGRSAGLHSRQPEDSSSMQQRKPAHPAAESDAGVLAADVLRLSPTQQRQQAAFGSGRRVGDLLPGADRAELDAVYRQQSEKGLTPGRRDSSRHIAADSGDYNQRTSVPESPLAASFGIAAEPDERAELTAALKCRSPGADARSMRREGNLFGRFAFRPTCLNMAVMTAVGYVGNVNHHSCTRCTGDADNLQEY